MKLAYELSYRELQALQLPIIVEQWEKKKTGRRRAQYQAAFNEKEREALEYWYPIIYRWYLVTGFPDYRIFRSLETVNLLRRAVNFFASM